MKIRWICVLWMVSTLAMGQAVYPFTDQHKQQQFERLTHELRCLVCQNEDLADSSAGLANDLRDQVYHMVQDGRSDRAIKHYLVSRYGDFVLFDPPVVARTYVLWFAPVLLLLLGLGIFSRVIRRYRTGVNVAKEDS